MRVACGCGLVVVVTSWLWPVPVVGDAHANELIFNFLFKRLH